MTEEPEPKQIQLMQRMVDLAVQRNEMSAERSYMNAERTLSVWVRTALGLMTLGLALDRFGLFLQRGADSGGQMLQPQDLSAWGGITLVTLGVVMGLTTGLRFVAYVVAYRRNHEVPFHHGPFLAPIFALLVTLFGVALLLALLFLVPPVAVPLGRH